MSKRSRDEDESVKDSDIHDLDNPSSPAKYVELDAMVGQEHHQPAVMHCSLPPHPVMSFSSTEAFDVHYAQEHSNRCTSCGRNFPSPHYLALHIDENHNPMREELAAKGERTYACFIEDCERKCSTPQKRRMHLIDKHMFPKAYNFRIIDRGIDKADSMLYAGQKRRLSTNSSIVLGKWTSSNKSCATANDTTVTANTTTAPVMNQNSLQHTASGSVATTGDGSLQKTLNESDDEMDRLENFLAALKFVPNSVQHRQRQRRQ